VWPALTRRAADGGWPGFAPNAGRLLGLSGPASALPFLAAVAAPLLLAGRAGRQRVERARAASAAAQGHAPLRA
jgi:hypothetical protein